MAFSPERLLEALQGFPAPPVYWVAFSGGLDSRALLQAMAELRPSLAAPVRALHVDHGIHPDSARWSDHCRTVCSSLAVPLSERRLAVRPGPGESPEAAARDARRAVFRELIGPGDLLLTAQHRDDQAETLLLQLLRGAGPEGLAAMPRLTPLPPGLLGRPLLGFSRAELRDYGQARGLDWLEDPSNRDLDIDRNFLRHRVFPVLTERWPACGATFSRSAGHCAEAAGLIADLAERESAEVAGTRPGTLRVSALAAMEPPMCRAVLRRWIVGRGFPAPDSRRLERILRDVLTAAPDRTPQVVWRGAELRRYRDDLFVLEPLPSPPRDDALPWTGRAIDLPGGLGRLELGAGEGGARSPGPPAGTEVRFGVPGATCRTFGQGHRRTLKNLFQERGVPDWIRPYVPLLFRHGRLVAVADLWVCHPLDGWPGAPIVWVRHPWVGLW